MPIVMSKGELARVRRWTDADREDAEVARRRELVRYQDETSRAMTKTWPNSLENVNKRNEEIRQARNHVAEQANANFYKKYVKRRKEQQDRLMYSARDTVFKNKDAPKLLLSAVIETCVQKERIEQIKFNEERKREANEIKRQEDEEIIRRAKDWEQHQANQKRLRYEADKKYQMEILEQAHEIAERNRIEYETELKMQKVDNIKANQQMDALKDFQNNYKVTKKARIFAGMAMAKREAEMRRAEAKARDKMDDGLIEVLNKSRARVEKKRLQTEKELKNEKMRVLENISSKLESGDQKRNEKEQAILDKTIKEKNLADEKRRKQQAQKETEMKQDRIEQRKQWEKDEAERIHKQNTKLQWEIMNRFKNVEVFDELQDKLREEKARKIKEYKEDVLRLWKEREDREARDKAETRYFYGELALKKLRDADNKLLTHAKELMKEARAHSRPDLALRKAVDRYCQLYCLYPLPELPASLHEHFQKYAPWDGSEPDVGYTAPPRPPPERTHDAPEGGPVTTALSDRNGLQHPPQSSTSKKEEKKDETVADYKRSGKANGLQRRNAETDLTLPQISVIPYKKDSFACGLN